MLYLTEKRNTPPGPLRGVDERQVAMLLGVPKEWKQDEHRVAVTPDKVEALVREGHQVMVEAGAGAGAGLPDQLYAGAGARIARDHAEVFGANVVAKVKEPQPEEYPLLREGLILFAFLHLAADHRLARELLQRGVTGIACETVQREDGSLPLLAPMSEIAGRLSPQIAAYHLQSTLGGPGKLLSGVPGVKPATLIVLGGGNVGANAARIALGMGARVILLDLSVERLRTLHTTLQGSFETRFSNRANIVEALEEADAVIGAVLAPGAAAPKVVTRDMLKTMKAGCVLVDVAIDQGGCFETSRPTTHSKPTYTLDGVIHYAVPNIPSLVAHTASLSLSNATFPYLARLLSQGFSKAVQGDPGLAKGVNTYRGFLTHAAVAQALDMESTPLAQLLHAAV